MGIVHLRWINNISFEKGLQFIIAARELGKNVCIIENGISIFNYEAIPILFMIGFTSRVIWRYFVTLVINILDNLSFSDFISKTLMHNNIHGFISKSNCVIRNVMGCYLNRISQCRC